MSRRHVTLTLLAGTMLACLVGCSPDKIDLKIFNRTGENLILIDRDGKYFDWPAESEFNLVRRDFRSHFENPEDVREGMTTHLTIQRGDAAYRYSVKLRSGTKAYVQIQGMQGTRIYKFRRILDSDFLIYEADAHDVEYISRQYPQSDLYPVHPVLLSAESSG